MANLFKRVFTKNPLNLIQNFYIILFHSQQDIVIPLWVFFQVQISFQQCSPLFQEDPRIVILMLIHRTYYYVQSILTRIYTLTLLVCGGNQITTLDLSQNIALTDLWCGSNQLSSLDVSNNTVFINLNCIYNPLTSLDVKNGFNLLNR